jgi:WD40 repeat protein/tRNA A-37 threonylcarbamoyl transferase component Bud32
MNQSACPSSERLGRLLAGDLPSGEESPLSAHLGHCPQCRERVEQLLADESILTWRRTAATRTAAGPPDDFMKSMRLLVPLVATSSVALGHPDGAPVADTLHEDPETCPEQIGGYAILGWLGRGGMAVVYKARQPRLGRTVALKVLRTGGSNDPDTARFFREAATVARMHHPNIVQVYEVGEADGQPFLALEYLPGGTLAEYLRGTPADPRDAAALLETVARAVHHAHEQGIVHRDLKPSNILLDSGASGGTEARAPLSTLVPKVSDFGLARAVTEDQSLTLPGILVGTPAYMAPELIHQPGLATTGGDVYALGVILYEMLTGRPPLLGPTALATLRLVDAVDPVPPSRLQPHLPRDLDTICLACLRKDPRRRYPSALALAEDLRRFLDGRPILARRVGRLKTGWLWCRRNPVVATLGVALVGSVLIGLVATLVLLGQARRSAAEATVSAEQAGKNEALALEAAARADINARLANDRAYASDIQFASLMWTNRQKTTLTDLLEGTRTRTDGTDRRGFEWYFLWACAHPPHRSVPLRNQGRDLATPRDGRYFAVATGESEVELLDATGKPLRTLAGEGRIIRVDVSADGRKVAGGAEDGTARVWDADTGRLLRTLTGHTGSVFAVRFHPNGRTLVTAGQDGARVWDTEDREAEPRVLSHPDVRFASAAFSPDGKRLVVGGSDRLVRVWDTTTWAEQRPLTGHLGEVLAVRFGPDSVLLASGSRDHTVRLWDTTAGKQVRVLPAHQDAVSAVAFSADGKSLASVSFDRSVRVTDVDSGLESRTLLGHDDVVTGVAFDPTGRTLASTGWDRTVRFWDLAAAQPHLMWRGHARPVRAVAFAPQGGLATGSLDGTVRVWDPATGAERQVLSGNIGGVLSLAFAPDGRLATAAADRQVRIWDLADGRITRTLGGHNEQINDVRFGAGGRLLAGAGEGGSIHIWDAAGGWTDSRVLVKLPAAVTCIRFDPTGATLAAGCRDGTVRLLDLATGGQRHQLGGHVGGVTALDFSPDGRWLAVGSVDRVIRVWDAEAGTLTHALRGHVRGVTAVCFGPDGRRLFSGSQDGTLQVWHADRGQPLVILTDQYETTALAVAPDGAAVASAGPTGVISVRRARTDTQLSAPPGR